MCSVKYAVVAFTDYQVLLNYVLLLSCKANLGLQADNTQACGVIVGLNYVVLLTCLHLSTSHCSSIDVVACSCKTTRNILTVFESCANQYLPITYRFYCIHDRKYTHKTYRLGLCLWTRSDTRVVYIYALLTNISSETTTATNGLRQQAHYPPRYRI